MTYLKYFFIAVLLAVTQMSIAKTEASTINQDNVIAQMNYCVNTLTNIIHNKSMAVLEHESDQLINNLTIEQIIGLAEIRDFRMGLMEAVGKFEITEEERSLMRRIQSMKRDNLKWSALSNALNPTMLLTGNGGGFGAQMVFQTLLTAARSSVEYKNMQGEQSIEELQAMWELRKEDMQNINELRKTAQGIVYDLYNKYHLRESDRLTEATASSFCDYIAIPDAARRMRILLDNYESYKKMPEYYYHLGMACLDFGDFSKAFSYFAVYLDMYAKAPILRYDEKSGCIALAMLTYNKLVSDAEKESYINSAIKNLPSNSAAVLQCAMVYMYELKQYEKGFQLLRSGIDDINASDRDLLLMAAANLLPMMKKYPMVYQAICEAFKKTTDVSYASYVTYLVYSSGNVWKQLSALNNFSKYSYRKWYLMWLSKGFSRKFHLSLPKGISFNLSDITVYVEKHDEDEVSIWQLKPYYANCIDEEKINDVKCFKANKNLKYLYVETVSDGIYKLKDNIDTEKIKDETWPRQSEFTLSESDIDDIVDFCEDNAETTKGVEVAFKDASDVEHPLRMASGIEGTFYGDSLAYKHYHSNTQKGYYVRMLLKNGIQVVYKYDDDSATLRPYYYDDGKNKNFVNKEAKEEYNGIVKVEEEATSSWWDSLWTSVSGWFSSSSEENVEKDTDEEPSWLSKTWDTVVGWFSSDETNEQSKQKEPSEKTRNKGK